MRYFMNKNDNEFVPNFDIPDSKPYKPDKKIIFRYALISFVICCIIIATVSYVRSKLTPAQKLKNGYLDLFTASENSPWNIIGVDSIIENMNSGKSTSKLDITLDELPQADMLTGVGVNITSRRDSENKKSENIVRATYRGTSIISCDLYKNKNKICFSAPSVFDKVISADLTDYFEFLGSDNISKVTDGIKIAEIKDENKIKLSISSDAMAAIIDSAADSAALKKQLNLSDNDMKTLASYAKMFFKNGVEIYTAFNSHDQITSIDFSNSFGMFSAKVSLKLNFNFTGKKNPSDKFDGTISFKIGNENYVLSVSGNDISENGKNKGKKYSKEYTVSFTTPHISTYALTANITETYTPKTGAYKFNLVLSHIMSDDPMLTFAINGSFSNIDKGHGFTFDMNNCSIGTDEDNVFVGFSGSYSYKDDAKSIKKPKGDTFDISGANSKALDELKNQIDDCIEKYKSMYSQLY